MHAFVKTILGDERLVLENVYWCRGYIFFHYLFWEKIHRLYIWYFPKGLLIEPFEMN